MDFQFPDKMHLANLPTPIHMLRGLSAQLGKEVYIKRDDLTGCALSGNKIRKLEYVLAQVKREGAQVVITAGGTQSNHCRVTALACRRVGLEAHLILRGKPPDGVPDGNLFLDLLCGAKVRIVEHMQYYESLNSIVEEVKKEEAAAGKKCYFTPSGASSPLGALGYTSCAREIADWQKEHDTRFDRIYYGAGSGGTSAGLIMGKDLYRLDAHVRGINVGEGHDELVEYIGKISREAIEKFDISIDFTIDDIEIVEGYCGAGYGDIPREVADCIKKLAYSDGIILDPVYTAKAMLGLIGEEKKRQGGRILFIHTGGIFSLFAFKKELGVEL